MIETINLSNHFTIYRTSFEDTDLRKNLLKDIQLNQELSTRKDSNSIWVEIHTPSFNLINSLVKAHIGKISQREFVNYAEHYWVYTQKKGFNMEWMHQHLLVHPDNRSNILTDYTFTFYVQIPEGLVSTEGNIVFETENRKRHYFIPNEGDIFIFPSDIKHTAIPTPNSKQDRIVYAGSLCLDILNQKKLNSKFI